MDASIEQRLTRTFQSIFDDPNLRVKPDTKADDVEGWDSLTHIDLIVAIEREFRVKFTTAEVTNLKNVGDLITLIERKLG